MTGWVGTEFHPAFCAVWFGTADHDIVSGRGAGGACCEVTGAHPAFPELTGCSGAVVDTVG
jgi:hypothetical protein